MGCTMCICTYIACSPKVLENKFCLPYFPARLSELIGKIICSILVGLGKDLNISWKENPPIWWALNIPYRHPSYRWK